MAVRQRKPHWRCRPVPFQRRWTVRTGGLLLVLALAGARGAVAGSPEEQLPDEPQGVVGLGDAIEAALLRNPDLEAFQVSIRIQDARATQARLAPNPNVLTEVEDVGGSGSRRVWQSGQTTLSIGQLLELGGKREKRHRAAELGRDLATFDYEARRLGILADVAKAFAATLAAQERLALARELEKLATESVQSVGATVKAGAVSPVEESRARVAEGRAATMRREAEQDLAVSRTSLAATWGGSQARFERVVGDLDTMARPPGLESLLGRVERNPDLARWNAERAQREAVLALERSRRVPDVSVTVGGRHYADQGDGALVLGFSLPLPLFDRNQGNIAAAEFALARAASEQRAAEVAVTTTLRTTYETLRTSYEQATALRDRIIPEARKTYDGARDGYLRGLFRYLEVLDAQRTLFELRGQYLEVLARYHQAAADITRLTGEPPSTTASAPGRTER